MNDESLREKNKQNISDGENSFRQLYQQIERLKAAIKKLTQRLKET